MNGMEPPSPKERNDVENGKKALTTETSESSEFCISSRLKGKHKMYLGPVQIRDIKLRNKMR